MPESASLPLIAKNAMNGAQPDRKAEVCRRSVPPALLRMVPGKSAIFFAEEVLDVADLIG